MADLGAFIDLVDNTRIEQALLVIVARANNSLEACTDFRLRCLWLSMNVLIRR